MLVGHAAGVCVRQRASLQCSILEMCVCLTACCANTVATKVTYSAHLQACWPWTGGLSVSVIWDGHSRCTPLLWVRVRPGLPAWLSSTYHHSVDSEVRSRCTVLEGLLLWVEESSPHPSSPVCVLTGWLAAVLICQLKITWVFYSIYVTGLGGAKPGQANASDCSTGVGTHSFTSATKAELFGLTQTHPVAWTLERDHKDRISTRTLQPWWSVWSASPHGWMSTCVWSIIATGMWKFVCWASGLDCWGRPWASCPSTLP